VTSDEMILLRSLLHFGHWKTISSKLRDHSINISAKDAYDALNPYASKAACGKDKTFISFSVGYRFCGPAKTCLCLKNAVSDSVSKRISLYSDETKLEIKEKRLLTNKERYGVENVFQREDVIQRNIANGFSHTAEANQKRKATVERVYGVSNVSQNEIIKEKIELTCMERYGTKNALSNTVVREKYETTMLSKYGDSNPMRVSQFSDAAKSTNLDRYGYDNPAKSPIVRNKIRDSLVALYYPQIIDRIDSSFSIGDDYSGAKYRNTFTCSCGNIFSDTMIGGSNPRCRVCDPIGSGLEHIVSEMLSRMGISALRHDRKIIAPYELDFAIVDQQIAIEVCGLYWHSNRRLEKDYHLQKMKMCQDVGWRLITIFEDEIIVHPDIVEARLRYILNAEKNRIHARKCKIVSVSQSDSYAFLEENHSQGGCKSPIRIGLEYEGELVALKTFSKARFRAADGYELVRFCTKGAVVGAAGRLFKHFEREWNPTLVVSYADRRWSEGNLYRGLGFQEIGSTPPNYWYFKTKKRYHRLNFTKQKLVSKGHDKNLTESKIMSDLGFSRIYDCGSLKFIWSSNK